MGSRAAHKQCIPQYHYEHRNKKLVMLHHLSRQTTIPVAVQYRKHRACVFFAQFVALYRTHAVQIIQQVKKFVTGDGVGAVCIKSDDKKGCVLQVCTNSHG